MDKSPSITCQEVDDGSWDLDENDEELVQSLENLSSNSWDSGSGKDVPKEGMLGCETNQTAVELFTEEDAAEHALSSDSWGSSRCESEKIIKSLEKRGNGESDGLKEVAKDDDKVDDIEAENEEAGGIGEKSPVFREWKHVPFEGGDAADRDIVKDTLSEIAFEDVESSNSDRETLNGECKQYGKSQMENERDSLVVEDLEDAQVTEAFLEDEIMKTGSGVSDDDDDDDSVWQIPMTERSRLSDDSDLLRDLMNDATCYNFSHRRCRSQADIVTLPKKTPKKSQSLLQISTYETTSLKDAVMQFEGRQMKEEKKENSFLEGITGLGEGAIPYQEIECRTLRSIVTNVKKGSRGLSDSEEAKDERENAAESCNRCNGSNNRGHAEISGKISEDAVSLPEMAGVRKTDAERRHEFRKVMSYPTNPEVVADDSSNIVDGRLTESWILLDESGQSQPVTLMEVNFLLNGRSADAVLQEKKEHFIPKSTVVRNANSDFRVDHWSPLVEESLQHFFNEDICGEESASKSIRLERKFGNMLLYIQSGINLTSSVRFIPVDTEMIHMWRQSKENVSPISSEDDARMALSGNGTEETSEFENQETSDEVRAEIQDSHRIGSVVRKRRCRQMKSDDCDSRMVDSHKIIDSLTDDIKQLRMRLEAERCRNSRLEQEIYCLRGQLDKCRSGRTTADSEQTKSEMEENFKKPYEGGYVPNITSSSLLSIEEFKQESSHSNLEQKDNNCLQSSNNHKIFKQALDRNLNNIQELLKCKDKEQPRNKRNAEGQNVRGGRISRSMEDSSRKSSFVSVNIDPVVDSSSQMLSETTGSIDSWFGLKKSNNLPTNITEIVNKLEKENEQLVNENLNLKKKLQEISIELDEYISSCPVSSPVEEGKQTESLRNQVCNLKLELENLKNLAKNKEQSFRLKNAIVREELAEKSLSLDEWKKSVITIFREMVESRKKLGDNDSPALVDPLLDLGKLSSNELLSHLRSFMSQMMSRIVDYEKENSLLKKSMQDCVLSEKISTNFDQADVAFMQTRSAYTFENVHKHCDDYYQLMSDKTKVEEEMQNLRKENDLLLEYQIEHNEKLKNSVLALREEKAKVNAMEKDLRLLEIEKREMSQALVSYQKERTILEGELHIEKSQLAELRIDNEKKKFEVKELQDKVQEAGDRLRSFDKTSVAKDEIIQDLKNRCNELQSREILQTEQIQLLLEEVKKFENEKINLEEESRLTKKATEESTRGLSEYICHLERMVSTVEDNFTDMKEKYNNALKSIASLKKTHDDLEKDHNSTLTLLNRTTDELEISRELVRDMEERNKRNEDAKKQALWDVNRITKSEKEKSEALEKLIMERNLVEEEISALKMKTETQAKARDRLVKEHKEALNKIAILKRENTRLTAKYRRVKCECNERTKLIRHMDGKLKENYAEYHKRIAYLEQNVTGIMEKAAAYKDSFLERRTEVNAIVRQLKEQLEVVCIEKKELESKSAGYYMAMKQLQKAHNEERKRRKLAPRDLDPKSENFDINTTIEDSYELRSRQEDAEKKVIELQDKLHQINCSRDEERNKYESVISDLKCQINKYQVRLEIMLNNISSYGKGSQESFLEKRDFEDRTSKISSLEQKVRELNDELERKKKRMIELTEVIEINEEEMRKKGDECESLKGKVFHLKEEIKNMKNQFTKLQEFLTTVHENVETYQKERDEVANKLAKSLQVIVEERASKQSCEAVFAEKEKMLKVQLEELKMKLIEKKNEYENLLKTMDDKRILISKLQDDVKKWKLEVGALKAQVAALEGQRKDGISLVGEDNMRQKETEFSSELKEIREINLELRKQEGSLQAKIVKLEDELRGARLQIKEMEGDIKTEKTSKKLLKKMISSAQADIHKFKKGGQIMHSIADKIERHFNLSEVQSRESFSGYRAALK